jgi:biotin carboxylase
MLMKTPRVLLLLPTTTYRAHDFIEAGRRLGIEMVVGSDQKQILEEASPGRTVTLDFSDPARAAGSIATFARDQPLSAIVPTDEPTTEIAAVAAARLGLRHNPPEAARATRYKNLLRERLRGAGIPQPDFRLVQPDEDPADAARRQTYSCVLKPTFLSASRGVIRADDPAGFVAALVRIRRLLARPDVAEKAGRAEPAAGDTAHPGTASTTVLVEEFIPGREVALEGILRNGRLTVLALFDKPDPLDGPFFEETIYVTPSRLPEATLREIERVTARGVMAVGLTEGPLHAELRINDDGVWLIELAARSIGGLCSRTLRFGTGLSLEELILKEARGDAVESLERERQASGVMMLPVPEAGILTAVQGLEEARSVPGVNEVAITIPVGQPVVPLPEGSAYLGFIFARGDEPRIVEASLREAHRRLRFRIEPEAGEGSPIQP